jgi:hypothetical protein
VERQIHPEASFARAAEMHFRKASGAPRAVSRVLKVNSADKLYLAIETVKTNAKDRI